MGKGRQGKLESRVTGCDFVPRSDLSTQSSNQDILDSVSNTPTPTSTHNHRAMSLSSSTRARRRRRSRPAFHPLLSFLLLLLLLLLVVLACPTHAFVMPTPAPRPPSTRAPTRSPPPAAFLRLLFDSVLFPLAPLLITPLDATAATTTTAAAAAKNFPPDVLATAYITLGNRADLDRILCTGIDENPALYVTARVGARGRVLASVKLPLSTLPTPPFPLEVQLKEGDIYADTPQAQHAVAEEIKTADLVLSARLDTDGNAATRSPEDLVGQGTMYKFKAEDSAQWARAPVTLTGRGAFGEFVTGGSSKGGGKATAAAVGK